MATSWASPAPREPLRRAAGRCRSGLSSSLFERLDDETWERLEEALILADVGARTTAEVVERLEAEVDAGRGAAAEARASGWSSCSPRSPTVTRRIDLSSRPAVVMVVGVNGTGKTTTIGKLAWHLRDRAGPVGDRRRRRHLPRGGRSSSSPKRGRSAPGPRSSAARRAATRARSSSTRSPRPRRAAPTW